MKEQEIFRRMAKLGIDDFETVADVERSQQRFLRNLEDSLISPSCYAGFENCNEIFCGRDKCSEVCRFGAYNRRLKHIPAAHDLITQCGEPIFEIRVARGAWVRPAQKLDKVSVGAAKKLNRRALDSLYNPGSVAIGAFKVGLANLFNGDLWVAEIHQLVAGVEPEMEKIEAAFTPAGLAPSRRPEYPYFIWVKKIENVGEALSNIFDYRLRPWRDPRDTPKTPQGGKQSKQWTTTKATFMPSRITMERWEEFYEWRFALPANICLIRYGCDRHFNKLTKEPRLIKARKKHPYPHWLERYFFGGPRWEKDFTIWEEIITRPRRVRVIDPNPDYFNLEDDDEQ